MRLLMFLITFLLENFVFSLDGGHCSLDGCSGSWEMNNASIFSTRTVLGRKPHPLYDVHERNDVYFSIKSTEKYHESRLHLLALTWFQTVHPHNLHIVTDTEDTTTELLRDFGYTVHIAGCPKGHTHQPMACKCGVEFEQFYIAKENGSHYNWYCHLDDDMYLNVLALFELLDTLNPLDSHYLGQRSINRRIDIREDFKRKNNILRDSYYFATGAIYCISTPLMEQLEYYLRGKEKMMRYSGAAGVPDDMLIGLIIEGILGYNLTEVSTMNSHLFPLKRISTTDLVKQITISYGSWNINGKEIKNIISIEDDLFDDNEDPTRFLSYHCLLHPSTRWCHSNEKT
ncbi:PREDICTED: beta-1,3-N-acetylglucosaminyltransferase lunatic fringe-like [Amphimedon queenslandica]|uniref:Fringe-like glycosyltransferase domain-containing protein n=1 Tax=Amphimedon queenslandica TaxID=400682 RepID=A0A1X7TX10_AMPQE|nr:PREDICTED: beta-1,3-N-acetylglucosaminyltransferase lunatic fringe-like [Amphimedon queenslandica]|eukprot:XP_011406594.2 PREDICTED: beta-1,3-N-acetylglucosaminyltransferase lunatic fringe-like [Amphimedon queenslandica]